MKIFLRLLMFRFLLATAQTDDDKSTFLPPVWPPIKSASDDHPKSVILSEDDGCFCREVPRKWVVCFGRESCQRFPKTVQVQADLFRLKTTQISELQLGDLGNLTHLTSLEIEGNFYLKKIGRGTFWNMTNLVRLSVSYNVNLLSLEEGSLEGLVNLEVLDLLKNGFVSVKDVSVALTPNILPVLRKLALSENVFHEIRHEDFFPMNGTIVNELNLILCQIEHIHPRALEPLTNLNALRLGENVFNSSVLADLVRTSFEIGIPLEMLNLYGVGFRKAPPKDLLEAIAVSKITNLTLARNQFEVIQRSMFVDMPHLEVLDLREVLALNITNDAFLGMPNLRTLSLSGNKLPCVPDGVLLDHVTYLDISDNSGDLYTPSYFALGPDQFVKMKKLRWLNLSYNRINALPNSTFKGLHNLRLLGLKNATIFHIEDYTFAPLVRLAFLNLENNPFPKSNPLTEKIFAGLVNLETLLLSGCMITNISSNPSPFLHLKSLIHLGLRNNKLITLAPLVLRPLKNLQTIDIAGNSMPSWQLTVFKYNKKIRNVSATNNKFTYLSEAMLQDFSNLTDLDVSGNPFTCECVTFRPLLNWWQQNENITSLIKLLNNNSTFCVYPDDTSDLTIAGYFETLKNSSQECELPAYTPTHIILIVALVGFGAVFVTLGILSYIYRWHIRYWLFLARLALIRRGKMRVNRKRNSSTNYEYDAFVSYSNEDRNFVIRLVAMLENYEPFLKLCVYERDFQIGTVISESVLECVGKSRRTLLIISDAYARSQWCRWETQIAEHHRLFERDDGSEVDDSLILIKLSDVAESHLTPTLKYLIKTRIYLRWDSDPEKQKIFWEKLRNTMTPQKQTCDTHL